MVEKGSAAPSSRFPLWRALGMVEEFVTYTWQRPSQRPLGNLDYLSNDELVALSQTLEAILLATHRLLTAMKSSAPDPRVIVLPRDPDEIRERVKEIMDADDSTTGVLAERSEAQGEPEIEVATWALREFLSCVETFISAADLDEELSVEELKNRLTRRDYLTMEWIETTGRTVGAACGLILNDVGQRYSSRGE